MRLLGQLLLQGLSLERHNIDPLKGPEEGERITMGKLVEPEGGEEVAVVHSGCTRDEEVWRRDEAG